MNSVHVIDKTIDHNIFKTILYEKKSFGLREENILSYLNFLKNLSAFLFVYVLADFDDNAFIAAIWFDMN